VSRKKKKKSRDRPNPATPAGASVTGPPQFRSGDKVRVKLGTRDPDFPDFPLGGWAGTIRELDQDSERHLYEVIWTDATLEQAPPIYRHRCEREGLDPESMWLAEEELILDPGGPVALEPPGQLIPRPLQPFDQEDRIRAILGLTSDDPLPEAGQEQLRRYHAFLVEKLSFPFNAEMWIQTGPFSGRMRLITVYRLLPLEEGGTEGNGLLAEAGLGDERLVVAVCDLEIGSDSPHRRLLQDYAYWFCNFGDGSGGLGPDEEEEIQPTPTRTLLKALLRYSVYGAGVGAVLGAILTSHGSWAVTILMIAGGAAAVLGWFGGSRYGLIFGAVNRVRGGPVVGGVLGCLAGAILGSSLGVFLVGCLGTIPGSIAGNLLGKVLSRFKIRPWPSPVWALLGACIGGIIVALIVDFENAVTGALAGAVVGGISTAVLFLFVVVVLGLMLSSRENG